MHLTEIDVRNIEEAKWNPNQVNPESRSQLQVSIDRFGFVEPLVVRKISRDRYETVGGAQRLLVIRELGFETVDCVVVETDDAESRLLAQALNRISGTDDPVKRQSSLELILKQIPKGEVLELLPDAVDSIGQVISFDSPQPTLVEHFGTWEKSRRARLKHFSAQLTEQQLAIVDQAIVHASGHGSADEANPNRRGNALFHVCQKYLSAVQSTIDAHL